MKSISCMFGRHYYLMGRYVYESRMGANNRILMIKTCEYCAKVKSIPTNKSSEYIGQAVQLSQLTEGDNRNE